MLSQRIYGLALGYEDINDHEQLRTDPALRHPGGPGGAGAATSGEQSTLNRMELGTGAKDLHKKITFWKNWIDELFVKIFVESLPDGPR